jgi:carbon storage regulator
VLVLTRKIGEGLMIGDEIEVIVLEKDGDSIRLGIRAPREVPVYRKEIFDEIKEANQSSLKATQIENLLEQYRQRLKNDEK